ncbi:hypothetical protein ACMYR3_01980 [Ampullimonas aquatilis]|uniref:hypothetical protein n=1 Tax=Ampullimonas aquatilis TaxID=1341549 RepID=UPI003C76A12D
MSWTGTLFLGIWMSTLACLGIAKLRKLGGSAWLGGLLGVVVLRLLIVESGLFKEGDPLAWGLQVVGAAVLFATMAAWAEYKKRR